MAWTSTRQFGGFRGRNGDGSPEEFPETVRNLALRPRGGHSVLWLPDPHRHAPHAARAPVDDLRVYEYDARREADGRQAGPRLELLGDSRTDCRAGSRSGRDFRSLAVPQKRKG